MKRKERERERARKERKMMGRITIDIGDNGSLKVNYPNLSPLAAIAFLELAKAVLVKQATSEPAAPPKPNIVIPTPVLSS